MYSLFERVDRFLLHGIFQRISDLWTDVTGHSSVVLSIVVGIMYIFLLSIGIILSMLYGTLATTLVLLANFGFSGLILPQFFKNMVKDESDMVSRTMNTLEIFWPHGMLRLMYGTYVIPSLVLSWAGITATPIKWDMVFYGPPVFILWCLMYIVACTPKPPSVLKAGNPLAAQAV